MHIYKIRSYRLNCSEWWILWWLLPDAIKNIVTSINGLKLPILQIVTESKFISNQFCKLFNVSDGVTCVRVTKLATLQNSKGKCQKQTQIWIYKFSVLQITVEPFEINVANNFEKSRTLSRDVRKPAFDDLNNSLRDVVGGYISQTQTLFKLLDFGRISQVHPVPTRCCCAFPGLFPANLQAALVAVSRVRKSLRDEVPLIA